EMIAKGWAKHLNTKGSFEEGKEALECFDPSAAQPLAHIAQVKELENALHCPEQFKHRDLKKYNKPSRHEALAATTAAWKALPPPDRELLLERLIKTSAFDLGE